MKKTAEISYEQFAIEPVELVEIIDEFSKLLKKIERYNPHVDRDLIKHALRFAAVAHAGQRRRSGNTSLARLGWATRLVRNDKEPWWF